MQENEISHYCQKCLAANPLGQDFCSRCGTRLMIVVEPASMRYDGIESGATNDEHLLERISVLENRLSRLTDRIERTLDLLLRQAQNSYLDRALLKSLIGMLTEGGLVDGDKLERIWQQRCEQDTAEQEQNLRRDELRAQILTNYRGAERAAFEQFVSEGFLMLEDGALDGGLKALQRAAELSPGNSPLLSLVGEQCFRRGRTKMAREYLGRAFEIAPDDNHLLLLFGLVCGDQGETEKARELIETATRRGGSSFAAHYGLGRLFAAEKKWQEALREFKRALTAKPSPEAHYALGCLYYELRKDELAAEHLEKAIEMDEKYAEAFYLLGLVYERVGKDENAQHAFRKARAGSDREPPSRRGAVAAPAPFKTSIGKYKRLVTGGDRRLAEALREDALRALLKRNLERG